MSTTSPTKQCPACGWEYGSPITTAAQLCTDSWHYEPFHGTGVVAAEHSNVPMTQNSLQEASPSQSHEHPAPTAEADVCPTCGKPGPDYSKGESGPCSNSWHFRSAPIPPAATDDEVMAILLKSFDHWLGERKSPLDPTALVEFAHAALEAHYAALRQREVAKVKLELTQELKAIYHAPSRDGGKMFDFAMVLDGQIEAFATDYGEQTGEKR